MRCIKLPYRTRNIVILRKLVSKLKLSIENYEQLCFEYEALTKKIILCKAGKIKIVSKPLQVNDLMSGLKITVQQPGLAFDDEVIWFKWIGTTFEINYHQLLRNRHCEEKH